MTKRENDDPRPRGTVQVECSSCRNKGEPGWYFWIAADDPSLPDGPFICASCSGVTTKQETAKEEP